MRATSNLFRSPAVVCGAFFRVLLDSLALTLSQLLRPALGGALAAAAALAYAFLYHPPVLLAGLRDYLCTVRARARAPNLAAQQRGPSLSPPHNTRTQHNPPHRRAPWRPTG